MSERLAATQEVPVMSVQYWDPIDSTDLFVPSPLELGIDTSRFGGILYEGEQTDINDYEIDSFACDGLIRFCGLIIKDTSTNRVTIANLSNDEFESNQIMVDVNRKSHKEVTLIYGNSSTRQRQIESQSVSGAYGRLNLRIINVESGDKPFGFIFSRSTGEVRTFTRDEPSLITTYSLFPVFV